MVSIDENNDKMLAYKHITTFFSGDDWKGSDRYKITEEQFVKYGVDIGYLPYTKGISTSEMSSQ